MTNRLLRHIIQFPVAIVMATYYVLTAIVGPIVRPIARALAKLHILQALHSAVEKLGPYSSLVVLAVPVIIIEPLKIGALAILASGRVLLGTVALVISHGLSLIIIEKLFAVVKPTLLTLGCSLRCGAGSQSCAIERSTGFTPHGLGRLCSGCVTARALSSQASNGI